LRLDGRAYQTGGGRTVDANVIDIMLTMFVTHDREAIHGGASSPTKLSTKTFPYFAEVAQIMREEPYRSPSACS
jgi:hypothetical protein